MEMSQGKQRNEYVNTGVIFSLKFSELAVQCSTFPFPRDLKRKRRRLNITERFSALIELALSALKVLTPVLTSRQGTSNALGEESS